MRSTTLKKDFYIPKLLKEIYQEMEISPIILLKNYALNQAYSKIHKYDNENIHFSKKYNCSFEEFNHKNDLMNDKKNFDWEDDLMDWKFAFENLKYWQKKAKEIQAG